MNSQTTSRPATAALAAAAAVATRAAENSAASGALDAAFDALKTYDAGSSRGSLVPIDEAVRGALPKEEAREALETRLLDCLTGKLSHVATEFVCAKLGLLGSHRAVPALAQMLAQADAAEPARQSLEVMPCAQAGAALREALPKLEARRRIGVIHSLRNRRDAASAPALRKLLEDADPETVGAAAAALGEIGTPEAGAALRKFAPKAAAAVRLAVADAAIACADYLSAGGQAAEARRILEALDDPAQAGHIRQAAKRRLRGN
jgi:HEAT repeat protein